MTNTLGELVLVRHGQSQANAENRFTGWTDIALSEVGMAEARRAGELLKPYRFDRAFTSALARAQETLRIILRVTGQTDLPVEIDAALNERHYGDLQGLDKDETARRFGAEQVRLWRRSYDAMPPHGESLRDTRARVEPYYDLRILPLLKAGKKVLVVAHGSSLRALIMALDQISERDIPALEIPTAAPILYRIAADGSPVGHRYL